MANTEHLAILKQGVADWNKWRKGNPDVVPDLSGADLPSAQLGNESETRELVEVQLDVAYCIGANLDRANLADVNAVEADLRGASLVDADLSRAVLRGASLIEADLTATRLIGADLHFANLAEAKLDRAHLNKAHLVAAVFAGAYLGDADLSAADLTNADLSGSNLKNANLGKADLTGVNLSGVELSGADLSGATTGRTQFASIDLSAAKGLETIYHDGPSTIGIDTIYKSNGKIPDVFLRGCGVSDDMIGYIKSIAGAIQFYSCFISYSTKDQEFADRLYADLQNKGVRCWFAPHDIKGGRKIHEQLDEAIRLHDKLLLILSEASMGSDWVGAEIANAREREAREGKQMLFPISIVPYDKVKSWKLFDADRGKDSAREIRQYFIPDFGNWKDHDSYQVAFQRMVKDLKAEAGK